MPRVASAIVIRPVVGVEVLLADPARVGAVDGQDAARVVRPEPPVLTSDVFAEPVGEDGPDPGLLEARGSPASAWSGVFMMCDQSTSVVMPALMHSSEPHRLPA